MAARVTSPSIASTAGTPTSSVRPSIDLNPDARAGSPAPSLAASSTTNLNSGTGAPPTQRRNRAALRDYYNLKAKSATQPQPGSLSRTASIVSAADSDVTAATATGSIKEGEARGSTENVSRLTAQLDDPAFDVDGWIKELLQTSTLREILRVEATLVSEIRNLDGERKALVYDNYSKLITAVGTIAEMQRGMRKDVTISAGGGTSYTPSTIYGQHQDRGKLDDVQVLNGKMEGLTRTVQELVGDEKQRLEKTQWRSDRNLRRDEKKKKDLVRWVLEAPQRLREMMKEGQQEEAHRHWKLVENRLNSWESVKGVDEVRIACEKIMYPEESGAADDA